MSLSDNSPELPLTQGSSAVKLNWILFDRSLSNACKAQEILLPRKLCDKTLRDCLKSFIRPLYDEYKVIVDVQDIIFWKTRNPLSIEDAEKTEWITSVDNDFFERLDTRIHLSRILAPQVAANEQIVHLVLTTSKKRCIGNEDLVDKWMSNRIVIPSLADLPGVLRAPLKDKIPIDASTYALLSCTDGRWKDRRSADAVERLFKIGEIERLDLYCLVSAILYPPPDHDAKGTWYYFWDTNIRFPLEAILGPEGKSNRYSEEPTQMRDVPPNYAFILSDTCVFRGEETASGDPENLMMRMAAKVNWIYDSAPYMLGYCCNGPNMTFVAIAPPTGSQGGRPMIYILATFDLRSRENRIYSLLHLVNLSTILPLLSKFVNTPVNGWLNFKPKLENKITNKFTSTLTDVQVERLKHVHALLEKYRVPNTDALISSESHSKLQRRRGVVRPQSEAKLRECLQCVLASLKVAHSIPLYHCNIRWDNILCEGPQKWILANWENATAKNLPTNTASSLPSSSHGYFPALSYVREAEMDIWSIGYLIQTCGIQDQSKELCILGEHIRRRAQSLTADEVYELITARKLLVLDAQADWL